MNKKELTTQVVRGTGMTAVAASKAIDAIFNAIKTSLENGEPVVTQGFGTFSVINRAQRRGVNPSTGKPMTIAARKAVKFAPSKNIAIK